MTETTNEQAGTDPLTAEKLDSSLLPKCFLLRIEYCKICKIGVMFHIMSFCIFSSEKGDPNSYLNSSYICQSLNKWISEINGYLRPQSLRVPTDKMASIVLLCT